MPVIAIDSNASPTMFVSRQGVQNITAIMDTGSSNLAVFSLPPEAEPPCLDEYQCRSSATETWNEVLQPEPRCSSCLKYGFHEEPFGCVQSPTSGLFGNKTYLCAASSFYPGYAIVGMQPSIEDDHVVVPYKVAMHRRPEESKICTGDDVDQCSAPGLLCRGQARVDEHTGTFYASKSCNDELLDVGASCSVPEKSIVGFDQIQFVAMDKDMNVSYRLWGQDPPEYIQRLRASCCDAVGGEYPFCPAPTQRTPAADMDEG